MSGSGRFVLLIILILGWVGLAAAVQGERYQEIRVLLPADREIGDLLRIRNVELMGLGDGDVNLLSRPSVTEKLIQEGWQVEVMHEDLEAFYASRQDHLRDYGIWHTYAEMSAELMQIHADFPAITTAPFSLGLSIEGRTIWAIKVSDNPNVDENEPEVLFDGVHHAREIMAVELPLYLARYLCENYGTDPTATLLVNEREIWFVPIVNPDGFVYNELTNPNGGGMWRKNRREAGVCDGVDNNRNYPLHWGDNNGSSPDPCDETYRGTGPASEPENQAMINFMNGREIVTHDSIHSVAALILFPWGYTTAHTPDDAVLRAIGNERARDNGYSVGQPPELLYLVSGGFNDWAYGEQATKPKIFSYTTEIGGSGFWPAPAERDGLIAENMYSMLYLAQVAGASIQVESLVVQGGNGNGRIEPGESVGLVATCVNDGVFTDVTNLSIQLRCDDPYVTLVDVSNAFGTVPPGENVSNLLDPFAVSVDALCPQGRLVTFTVVADADGGVHREVPFVFEVGSLPSIYANDFENAGEEWQTDQTHNAVTGAFVRVDPVAAPWQPGDDTTPAPGVYAWITAQNPNGQEGIDDVDSGISATRSPDFDLSGYQSVRLSMNYFLGQRDQGDDPSGDFFRIDVSSNAGATWANLLLIGDVASQAIWRNLTLDLEDAISLTNQVRLRVQASDAAGLNDVVEAGIDDVSLVDSGSGNAAPSAPTLVAPPDGSPDEPAVVTLVVANATDPEGDPLTYGFRVFADADLTQLVASVDGVAEGAGTTSWTTPALGEGTHYWRAYAADAGQRGLYMDVASFTVTDLTAADDLDRAVSSDLAASPNPAQAGTKIRYLVPATLTSRLEVYDPQGRRVRRLDTIPSASGWQETVWDGRDDEGRSVAAGSYWVRLWTPGEVRTVRVVRID